MRTARRSCIAAALRAARACRAEVMACLRVEEIYGLEGTKAMVLSLQQEVFIELLNTTASVAQGWLAREDDVLLRETQEGGNTLLQPAKVQKTFVYHDVYVVHTDLGFDSWCKVDCGCAEKGYFGFSEPRGMVSESTTDKFLRHGGLLCVIILMPLLLVTLAFYWMRHRRRKNAKRYREAQQSSEKLEPPDDAAPRGGGDLWGALRQQHRAPPVPLGSPEGDGTQPGRAHLSWGAAGAAVMLAQQAHRPPPAPPSMLAAQGLPPRPSGMDALTPTLLSWMGSPERQSVQCCATGELGDASSHEGALARESALARQSLAAFQCGRVSLPPLEGQQRAPSLAQMIARASAASPSACSQAGT